MADSSARLVGCLFALLTALAISMVGPVTAGVVHPGTGADDGSVPVLGDPGQSSTEPVFSNAPPSPDADTTVTRIQVAKNGTATWSLQIRTRLKSDSEMKNYRVFMDRFRNNTSDYLGPFTDSITTIVGNAEQATGREMKASNFQATTSIQTVPRRWGVVTYKFTWTKFAETDGSKIVVGDIFQGGYFIAENDTLVISGPHSYTIASIEPSPDQRDESIAAWDGRKDFAGGHPHVEFAPATGQDGNDANNQATGVLPSTPVLGAIGGLAIVLAGAVMVARRKGFVLGDDEPMAGGSTTSTTDGGASTSTGGNGASATVSPDKKDRELLADVDKVTRVLEEAGGRMKQSEIGEELDWSKAKTSRVLSRLEDDGKIEKLRLGRENVIDLADDDGGGIGSSSSSGDDGSSGDDSGSDDSGSDYGYSP